jgi:hypothetical protein
VTRYEDVALTAVASADMEQARRFVASELGPLAEQDDDMQRLAATLRVYLEEHSSARNSPGRSSEPRAFKTLRTFLPSIAVASRGRLGEYLVEGGEVAVRIAELACSGEHLVCGGRRGERDRELVSCLTGEADVLFHQGDVEPRLSG